MVSFLLKTGEEVVKLLDSYRTLSRGWE